MDILLDFHTHRDARPGERAWRSFLLPKEPLPASDAACCTAGVHPWDIPLLDGHEEELLRAAARHPSVVALGETGLDSLCPVPMDEQLRVFHLHIALSEQYAKPLVIHCVRCQDLLLAERRNARARMPWAWHGFRGNAVQLAQLARHGLFFSFGCRFRDDAVCACPADRLLLETDGCDTPLSDIYARVAALRHLSVSQLSAWVGANACSFLGRPVCLKK